MKDVLVFPTNTVRNGLKFQIMGRRGQGQLHPMSSQIAFAHGHLTQLLEMPSPDHPYRHRRSANPVTKKHHPGVFVYEEKTACSTHDFSAVCHYNHLLYASRGREGQDRRDSDGAVDPASGGDYPEEYEGWKATAQPTPEGKSKYKKGNDGGKVYDKLSEYPFNALLFNGWGFGIECDSRAATSI